MNKKKKATPTELHTVAYTNEPLSLAKNPFSPGVIENAVAPEHNCMHTGLCAPVRYKYCSKHGTCEGERPRSLWDERKMLKQREKWGTPLTCEEHKHIDSILRAYFKRCRKVELTIKAYDVSKKAPLKDSFFVPCVRGHLIHGSSISCKLCGKSASRPILLDAPEHYWMDKGWRYNCKLGWLCKKCSKRALKPKGAQHAA